LRCIVALRLVECVASSPRFTIDRRANDAFFEHRGQLGELADLAVLQRIGSQCPAGATMVHASG
jgi:hypothetical protein